MTDQTKLFYDLMAEKTADEWYANEILKPTVTDFVNLFSGNPHILDFGCGPGHESKRLQEAGAVVTGVDYSERCISIARERCPDISFELQDFRNLNIPGRKYDGVFACASLIHVSPEQLPSVLENITDAMNEKGYVSMIVQDGEGQSDEWSKFDIDGQHINRPMYLYSALSIIKEASKVGLLFVKEGYLDSKLYKEGWRNYIFLKMNYV